MFLFRANGQTGQTRMGASKLCISLDTDNVRQHEESGEIAAALLLPAGDFAMLEEQFQLMPSDGEDVLQAKTGVQQRQTEETRRVNKTARMREALSPAHCKVTVSLQKSFADR